MGPESQRSAQVLAAVTAVVALVIALGGLSRLANAALTAAALAVAEFATWETVGRVPGPLAVVGLILFVAVIDPSIWWRSHDRPPTFGALPVLATHAIFWVVIGSNALAAALLATAVAILVLAVTRPRAAASLDMTMIAGASLASKAASIGWDGIQTGWYGFKRGLSWFAVSVTRGAKWATAPENRVVLVTSTVAGLVTIPIFWRQAVDPNTFIRGTNDINSALPRIDYIQFWPPRSSAAHPTYMVLIKLLLKVTSLPVATTLVASLSIAATVAVLMAVARSRWDSRPPLPIWMAAGFGLSYIFLENPAAIVPRGDSFFTRFQPADGFARGTSFASTHQWATPTIIMSLPFALALLWLLLRLLNESEPPTASLSRYRWHMLALTVFLTILQPATTLALAPAVPVYLILSKRLHRDTVRSALWFVVPGTAIVLAQVWFLASNVSPYEQATWLWRPFWVWHYFGLDRAVFFLTFVFYLFCIGFGRRRYITDPAVALSAIALFIAMWPFLLLEHTTVADIPDGDLGVPPLMAMILLFMSSLRFWAIELHITSETPRQRSPWLYAASAFLLLMLVAGVVDFLGASGIVAET